MLNPEDVCLMIYISYTLMVPLKMFREMRHGSRLGRGMSMQMVMGKRVVQRLLHRMMVLRMPPGVLVVLLLMVSLRIFI